MRTTSGRARVLFLLAAGFAAGLAFMLYTFISNAGNFVMKPVNTHLYTNGVLSGGGSVLDRNGVVLSSGENGKRVYNSSSVIRRSTLHAVGDSLGYIATGVQKTYSAELIGYSLFWGVNMSKDGRGGDLKLTLDSKVCAAALEALDGRNGTVGVYNYKTGEIICMVSTPTYDVNNKPEDIDTDESGKYDGVYVNKLLSGLYVPGSVFKTVTAVCAVENISDIASRTFVCNGEYNTGDGVIICSDVHGTVNFEKALSRSCNVAFAQIAIELGKTKLENTFNALGLSSSQSIDRIDTTRGSFDVKEATKAELGWAGIGQHTTMVNPLSVMTLMGAIANGGVPVKPYYVDSVKNAAGLKVYGASSGKTLQRYMDTTTANTIKNIMRYTVKDYYGESLFPDMELCAKSGTAEVGGGKQPHAWFAGFSMREDFPYAFVVVIENGGKGYANAAPVASKVLKAIKS